MGATIYPVVRVKQGECDDIAAFETQEAAVQYAEELIKEDYDVVSVFLIKTDSPFMQVTVAEYRKGCNSGLTAN